MENEKYDLEKSIFWYQTVVDSFPEDETVKLAKNKVKMLKDLVASLDKPEEIDTVKVDSLGQQTGDSALTDSVMTPGVETESTTPDSAAQKEEKIDKEKTDPASEKEKALEEKEKEHKAAMENEARDDPIKNKGTVKKHEKDLPVKNIEK